MKYWSTVLFCLIVVRDVQSLPSSPADNDLAKEIRLIIGAKRGSNPSDEDLHRQHTSRSIVDDIRDDPEPNLEPGDVEKDLRLRDDAPIDQTMDDYAQKKHEGGDKVMLPLPAPNEPTFDLEIETSNRTDETSFVVALVPGPNPNDKWVFEQDVKYGDLRKKLSRARPEDLSENIHMLLRVVLAEAGRYSDKVRPDCQARIKKPKLPNCHPRVKRRVRPTWKMRNDSLVRRAPPNVTYWEDDPPAQSTKGKTETAIEASREYVHRHIRRGLVGYARTQIVFFVNMIEPTRRVVAHVMRSRSAYAQAPNGENLLHLLEAYRFAIDTFCFWGTLYVIFDKFVHVFQPKNMDITIVLDVVMPLVNTVFDALVKAGRAFDRFLEELAKLVEPEKLDKSQQCLNTEDLKFAMPAQPASNDKTWVGTYPKPSDTCPADEKDPFDEL